MNQEINFFLSPPLFEPGLVHANIKARRTFTN